MKTVKKVLAVSILLVIVAGLVFIGYNKVTPELEKTKDPKNYPDEWFSYQRAYPYGEIKTENYLAAMKDAVKKQKLSSKDYDINWESAGPYNIGGRISDIEITAGNPSTIYVGVASGGIFKTTDEGSTWQYAFSGVPTIGIGDIAIDPNNEDIIYAGTGESNASSNTFLGSGIYKSTDAGMSWEHAGLENSAYIGRLIVDYDNSSRLFAAACGNLFTKNNDRGIYRTTNGGNTWENVLFVSDSTSGIDIVQHPSNPDILYAAMWERFRGKTYRRSFGESSGIYRTTNGGDTWNELTSGLPTGSDVGRIGLTISESNPDVLYAIYDKSDYSAEVYKTTNGGNLWTQTNDGSISSLNNYYGWYFGQIRVSPQDENLVFAMGMNFARTQNSGDSWSENYDMHVDHHAMEFTDTKIWEGNDGGLYYSSNNGNNWIKVNNLPLTQFYDIAIDSTDVNKLYGGTQDNNSIRTATGNTDNWEVLLGGDGMYCLVDYSDPSTFYCEYQNGGMFRLENNGNLSYYIFPDDNPTNWSTPYIMHPENPDILYVGTYRVQKSTNRGDSWTPISSNLTQGGSNSYHTITTLDISALNPNIIISGSADGKVYITSNDGDNWTDISQGLPDRWITRVKTDPFNENTIYVTVSGFRWDEHYSHVYKSTNLGADWLEIGGDLPQVPVNVILIDPDVEGRYFVGTDAGIYMTENGGSSWAYISQGIPNAPVMAMEFHHAERILFAGTYGVSAYKAYIPTELIITNTENLVSENSLSVYPIPYNSGNGSLHITIPQTQSHFANLSVYNVKGQLVYNEKINLHNARQEILWNGKSNKGKIQPKGIYFLKLKTGVNIFNQKLVIE